MEGLDTSANLWMEEKLNKVGKAGISYNDAIAVLASGNIKAMVERFKQAAEEAKVISKQQADITQNPVISFKQMMEEMVKNQKESIETNALNAIMEYGEEINAKTTDDYLKVIKEIEESICRDILIADHHNKSEATYTETDELYPFNVENEYITSEATYMKDNELIPLIVEQPSNFSTATNQDINTKIVL